VAAGEAAARLTEALARGRWTASTFVATWRMLAPAGRVVRAILAVCA